MLQFFNAEIVKTSYLLIYQRYEEGKFSMSFFKIIGKKALPILLCLIMVISALPVGAFTAFADEIGNSGSDYSDEAEQPDDNDQPEEPEEPEEIKLGTPVLSSVSNAATGAKISWKKVKGAEKYRVYYKTGKDGWQKAGDTTDTSFIWTKAKSGTKYYFTVCCLSADGKRCTSDYNTTGLSLNYIAAPKISLTTNSNSIQIKWNKVDGAQKYRVFYKNSSGTWKKVADTAATSYTYSGTKRGEKYTFTVRCISKDGKSYTSSYDPAGQTVKIVAEPKISSVSNTASGVKISWGKVSGAEKYRVFYKNSNGDWTKIADTASTSFTWSEAKSGKKYTFTVRCINKDARSYASTCDATGKSITFVAAPKISTVSTVTNGVQIKWNKPAGAVKFRVYYKNGSSWTKIGDTTSTSYTWNGAKVGKSYTFTVRCISSDAKSYTSGYYSSGKKFTYLSTPKLSSVSADNSGIIIKWNKVSGAEKYKVFYKTGSGEWTKIANTSNTEYTWKGAKSGTNYTFTVRCITSDGSAYTSWYDSTGKSIKFNSAPKLSSVTAGSKGITIKWNKVSGAEKYKILRKTGNGNWTAIGTTAYTSFTDIQTDKGLTYTYTVRCVNLTGGTNTSGYDTTGKSVTATATPSRDSDMIEVAKKELGVTGGKKYWSWAGYSSRVPWCNIFVTWCADQLGYYESGRMPLIQWPKDSVKWFKERGLFKSGSYVPKPGDLIYLLQEGGTEPYHIGIVERYENGTVYTIEGNAGDIVKRRSYEHGGWRVYGYATPDYGHN